MKDEKYDWYEDEMEILAKAMLKAKETFDEYINEEMNLNGVYWEIEMTGFVLDSTFSRWKQIEMEFKSDKDDREELWDLNGE